MSKKCTKCGEVKPLSDFYKNATYKDGFVSKCKICHVKQTTENYKKKPEINESNKKRYFKNINAERNRDYKRKYGITLEDYNKMLQEQKNSCAVCGLGADSASKGRLFVDHCHTTHKVRGLLCHHCNTMLGLAKDNIDVLQKSIEYLKGYNE
jgi:hypothetical protein